MTKQNIKRHGTKTAFMSSLISLLLCVAMLVGTTFAWFTDTVTSGENIITAGNLDIGLQYKNDIQTDFADVTAQTNVFKTGTLWEPGHVEYAVLKISNLGTLALKYGFTINIASETGSISVKTNEAFKLSDFLKYAVVDGDLSDKTRDEMVAAAGEGTVLNSAYTENATMLAGDDKTVTFVVWMPSTVDNAANYKTGAAVPQITLGIALNETQYTVENDSFDNQYDVGSPWMGGFDDAGLTENTDTTAKTVKIESAEQLASFAKSVNNGTSYKDYTITLERDIDLNNVAWTPINAGNWGMTFDGNNKAVLNVNATGEKNVGLFGTFTGNTMKDLTVDGATVTGINHVAALAGDGLCGHFDNCTVKNANITTSVKNNDDGDKAGAITGYLSPEPTASITNCKVEDCIIKGYRDIGAVVGYVNNNEGAGGATVTGNTVNTVTLINDRSNNYKNYTANTQFDVNDIIGELCTNNTVESNTATNVTKTVANCDHSIVSAYTVKDNELYLNCDGCGQNDIKATSAQLTALAGKVIVKNGETYTVEDNLATAVNAQTAPIEVWLTSGTYTLAGINKDVTVNELVGAEAVITSYSVDGTGKKGYYGVNGNVIVNGCTMQGSMAYSDGWYLGIQATSLTCNNCAFVGKQTAYSATMTCNSCTFDCTGITGKVDYTIYCYNTSSSFTGCTFKGCGKAVKIYSESGTMTGEYTFDNCTFTQVGIANGAEASNKAAIQIDSTYVASYTVNINSCTQTGFTALYNDTGSKSTVNAT